MPLLLLLLLHENCNGLPLGGRCLTHGVSFLPELLHYLSVLFSGRPLKPLELLVHFGNVFMEARNLFRLFEIR
jgi:hypothetical protein